MAVRAMSRGVPVGAAMMTQFATLLPDASVDQAIETLLRTSQNEFPVVDGAGRPAGVLGPKRSDRCGSCSTVRTRALQTS